MTPDEPNYRQRILQVQLFIQGNLDGDLSLERLARVAHFSPYHFHRIFRGLVGEGVYEYVRRLRLESAAMALKTTGRDVLQIALDAGYGAHEAFTRAFRQMFGVSPSQYRAGNQPAPRQPEVSVMSALAAPPDVRIENQPARRVLFLRNIGPYCTAGQTFQKLMGYAFRKGLFRPGALVIGICHDDPDVTPPEKIRCDCALTVGDDVSADGEYGIQTIEGGVCAVATHRGPYEKLQDSYRWLYGTWLPSSGREPRHAPVYEVYRNNPQETKPDDLVTDIYIPLV
jgi:AraC family transcriptional regulator